MTKVEKYIKKLFVEEDHTRNSIIKILQQCGVSANLVSPEVAKTLYMLVRISGATNILEIGSLAGYSSFWLARGLDGREGKITSLEISPALVELAKLNARKEGFANKINYIVGPAIESLDKFIQSHEKFDFFFIDADKVNYSAYLERVLKLAIPGALIVADNVLWKMRIFDSNDHEQSTEAIREFNNKVSQHSRLDSMLFPIGDGLIVAIVKN